TEDNNISNRKTKREYLPKEPSLLEKHYSVSKKVLGRGSFAVVKECTDRQQMLTTELDVLKQVNHPNIVSLHDLYETKDAVYIITDLALGGELYNQLLQRGSYTEKDAANLIEQIAHRDLKPENLLFSDKSEFSTLKITDFGLSKILKHHDDILMTACGTPGYVAPEVLTQNGYGKSVDIWSIGVILYTVLCGYTPFWGENQKALFDSILKGVYHFDEDYWSDISDEAKDLINKMLEYNPDKRITAHDALQHPWFKSLGSSELFGHIENEIIDEYTKDVNDEKMETNKILINTNSIWSSEGSESDISSIYSISTTSLSLTPSIPNIP
ncbi:5996_t:CDS:2, partial [Dentiscutata erythropus]